MLRKVPYNLNAMSHDAAIDMIRCVLDAGVKVDTWYVILFVLLYMCKSNYALI